MSNSPTEGKLFILVSLYEMFLLLFFKKVAIQLPNTDHIPGLLLQCQLHSDAAGMVQKARIQFHMWSIGWGKVSKMHEKYEDLNLVLWLWFLHHVGSLMKHKLVFKGLVACPLSHPETKQISHGLMFLETLCKEPLTHSSYSSLRRTLDVRNHIAMMGGATSIIYVLY